MNLKPWSGKIRANFLNFIKKKIAVEKQIAKLKINTPPKLNFQIKKAPRAGAIASA